MGFGWPDNWEEKPALIKVSGNTTHFADGSTKDVDSIISMYRLYSPFSILARFTALKNE